MNKNDQNFIAKKIRSRYTEKQSTELDALRKLDAKVKRPASIYAYVFGSISALVMGAGMSLVLTDIGGMLGMEQPLIPGIVVGAVGLVLALLTYPVYKRVLGNRKKKYAPEILALSEKIMNR